MIDDLERSNIDASKFDSMLRKNHMLNEYNIIRDLESLPRLFTEDFSVKKEPKDLLTRLKYDK